MPSISPEQFEQWALRLKQSDEQAGEELFRAMYPPLRRYALQLVGSHSAAEDVVQDAFFRIWRGRDSLDPSNSLRGLLFVTVRNLALTHMARSPTQEVLSDHPTPAAVSADEHLSADILSRRIEQWVGELPERRREAFVLSRYERLTYAEIAKIMGLSVKTVERHMQLALEQLRERVRAFDPELLNL